MQALIIVVFRLDRFRRIMFGIIHTSPDEYWLTAQRSLLASGVRVVRCRGVDAV